MASAKEIDFDPNAYVGLTFPLRRSATSDFEQTKNTLEAAKHNIKNLLLTHIGERVGQPTFGSNIYNILFENFDIGFTKKLEDAIKESVATWLPHVLINNLIVSASPDTNTVSISVGFSIITDPSAIESLTLNLRRAI